MCKYIYKPLQLYIQNVSTSLGLTHRDPCEDKQSDARGHPEQAVADGAQQQAGQQGVPAAHHVTPAPLPRKQEMTVYLTMNDLEHCPLVFPYL